MRHVLPLILTSGFLGLSSPQTSGATEVMVHANDLVSIGPLGWIAPQVIPPAPDPSQKIVSEGALKDPSSAYLQRLANWRRASGFAGAFYDNRDRGHSLLPADLFPGLARLAYGPELRAENIDYGLGGAIIYPAVVIGNSSTAVTSGINPRSLPRYAMTNPGWPERSYRSYISNHIYVYPEHQDHDEVDLFPANWPYMVISQGSSGTDRPFLRALSLTLAALPPATRQKLVKDRLIAPTLQMILRRSLVLTREEYMTGAAHPTVFEGKLLAPEQMMQLAAALTPDVIPPMVRLRVQEESFSHHAGLTDESEELFNTASAIGRIWRSEAWQQTMVVTTEATKDPNGRPLTFNWVLLRGNPDHVRIEPLDLDGGRARLTLEWQDARSLPVSPATDPAPPGDTSPPRLSSRIDIGVFASNGVQDSAPAFISVSLPVHQLRQYEAGPDGILRLASVDYDANARDTVYETALYWSAPWSDKFTYDASGQLTGWTRTDRKGDVTAFKQDGRQVDGTVLSYEVNRKFYRRNELVAAPQSATDPG